MRRRVLLLCAAVATALLALGVCAGSVGWFVSAPGHRGPASGHFDGLRFSNTLPTPTPGGSHGLRMLSETRATWAWRAVARHPLPAQRVEGERLRVTFINHATVLLQVAGLNILTDPIWSDRCSAVQWIGPHRYHDPPFPLEDLPPIDIVLISHNHYDHLDIDTLLWLREHHGPQVFAGLGNAGLLRPLGLDVVDMDWGDRVQHGPVTLIGAETRHFSSRGLFDRNQTLWLGFVIEAPGGPIYFGGDTGYGPHFADTGEAFGPFRLAMLPIGAYAPRWFMGPIHQNPAEAVAAHADLDAQSSLGIHFGTFQLTTEGQDEPVHALGAALDAAQLPRDVFRALAPGEGWEVEPI
jgi:L-ascorbate metabolism protein UlaG (beta-lactamase superfamily)